MAQITPAISHYLAELRRHPSLQGLVQVTPAVDELSHDWHDALHFTARGAATGTDVVIKAGVASAERYWTVELSRSTKGIVPALFGEGEVTGPDGEPVEFIATERLPHSLIGDGWGDKRTGLLLDAAARFQSAARAIPPKHLECLTLEDVREWFGDASVRSLPGDWRAVVQNAERDFAWLASHSPFVVCHGDVHVGNAFSRNPPPNGPAILIDINPILQPWVFDAAWVEACSWPDTAEKGVLYTVRELAERRRTLGLDSLSDEVVERAGRIALSWHAIRNWNPDYLDFMPGFKEATEEFIRAGALLLR